MKELEAFLENFSDRIVEKTIERLKEEGLVTKERHEEKYAPPRVAHSITEMARRLDISPWTVKQWMDKGMLEGCYIRQGKTIVFISIGNSPVHPAKIILILPGHFFRFPSPVPSGHYP